MKNPDFWAKSGPNPAHFAQKSLDPDQSLEIRTKVGALIVGLPNKSLPKPKFDTKYKVLNWDFLAGNLCIVGAKNSFKRTVKEGSSQK